MFKSKLQWEVTIVCHGVRIFWTSLSKWPSWSQRRCQCFFLQRESREEYRKGSVVDPHGFQCGSGSSILGQCRCGSRSRDLMTKHFTILQLKKKSKIASLGIYEGRPSHRRSFQPPQENIQHFKNKTFLYSPPPFLWVIFDDLIPDVADQNQCESGPLHWGRLSLFDSHFYRVADIWLLYICHIHCKKRLLTSQLWRENCTPFLQCIHGKTPTPTSLHLSPSFHLLIHTQSPIMIIWVSFSDEFLLCFCCVRN